MSTNIENTFKRANELVEVGQKVQALNLLFELISNRRQLKRMWTKVHEDTMMLFVRLCVDLRDNRVARDGLHSYRGIAQAQAPGSLEAVISYMLDLTDERVAKAVAQSKTSRDLSRMVEDLEEGGGSPEAMLLASVSADRDRISSEQGILIPWLKFSWENLRSVLDILKSNPALEQTYHATAHRAFAFCKTYNRKVEFRRLCELLRTHLANQTKSVKEGEETGKLSGETMELHLGTRFEQLKVATHLHLWIEGFRTIEDIHSIINLSVKKPSAQLMATYYQKLTQMFLVSGNFLFHAFAFRSYYDLSRERNKALTQDQIKTMASSVLLAAMSISLPAVASLSSGSSAPVSVQNDGNMQKEKNRRMAQLLGFDQINPEREALLKALRAGKVLEDCSAEARELYYALELQTNFDPQNLVKRCAPKIAAIRADPKLEAYAGPIEQLLIIRLISQLGRVFQTVRLGDFHGMIDELGPSMSRLDAEKLVVKAVRARQIPLRHGSDVKIDHASGTVKFGENALEEQRTRDSLSDLAKRLSTVCKDLKKGPFATAAAIAPLSALPAAQLQAKVAEEQAKLLERRATIAARKQELDDLAAHRARVRQERDEAARKARFEREQTRAIKLAEENRKREDEKRERLLKEEEDARVREQLGAGAEGLSIQERERLVKEKQEKQVQQALEAEKRMQSRAKRLDAWIRATREAEKPLLTQEREKKKVQDREEFAAETTRAEQQAKERHTEGLVLKASFARMQPFRDSFEKTMDSVWKKNVEAAKQRWIQEREDRKREQKLERARLRQLEDQKRRRQEEEAARRAEMEAKRIQEAEEENRRREERMAQLQQEAAAAGVTAASEAPKWRPRGQIEPATLDDSFQGKRKQQEVGGRGDGPTRGGFPTPSGSPPPSDAAPKEGSKGVWRPKFLQNRDS